MKQLSEKILLDRLDSYCKFNCIFEGQRVIDPYFESEIDICKHCPVKDFINDAFNYND